MIKTAVITDTNSGISVREGEEMGIYVLPMPVIVDGKEYHYKDVFLASTMKGRFYGGGMMAAPDQDRNDPEHKVSVLVFRGKIRLQVLLVFSKIFTGEHLKNKIHIFLFLKSLQVNILKTKRCVFCTQVRM